MKFRFCGNVDCPEWFISEIVYLYKINAIKIRIISNSIIQAILSNTYFSKAEKLLEEMSFSEKETKIIIASLFFIFKSTAKFEVDSLVLNQELQMLGLPLENIESIVKVYKSNEINLKNSFYNQTFSEKTIESIKYKINYLVADTWNDFNKEELNKLKEDEEIKIKVNNSINKKVKLCFDNNYFVLSKEKLGLLINNLEKGLKVIKNYD